MVVKSRGHFRGGFDEFFQERSEEPFFVKSIERVQGDYRDAIILSVGYGKGHLKNQSDPYAADNRRVQVINMSDK